MPYYFYPKKHGKIRESVPLPPRIFSISGLSLTATKNIAYGNAGSFVMPLSKNVYFTHFATLSPLKKAAISWSDDCHGNPRALITVSSST